MESRPNRILVEAIRQRYTLQQLSAITVIEKESATKGARVKKIDPIGFSSTDFWNHSLVGHQNSMSGWVAIKHCFNTLFRTSVGTQANMLDVYTFPVNISPILFCFPS